MASADKGMTVEVVYARPEGQVLLSLEVPQGCTLLQAVRLSGLPERFPEIDVGNGSFGVFGHREKAPALRVLQPGERVEIYRPLLIDPKEARRARAEKAKARRASEGE